MIFKKTILTLSLCLASGLALAATTEPAPSATPTPTVEAEQNLAQGAPAYTLTWGESTGSGFMFYPGLSDGIRAHANSAADAEKWGPELGFQIQMHVVDHNNLVKRTLSFPTKKYAKINVEVSKTAGQTTRNFYGYEVVDPQKEPAIVEIQAFNIPQASPAP